MNLGDHPEDEKFEDTDEFEEEDYLDGSVSISSQEREMPFKKTEMILLVAGAVVLGLIILFFIYFPGSGGSGDSEKIAQLEEQVLFLEGQVASLKLMTDRISILEGQFSEYQKVFDDIGRKDREYLSKIDDLNKKVNALKKQVVKVSSNEAKKPAVKQTKPKTTTAPKPVYHYVKKGETFYSICKKYNVKPDDVLTLNKLKDPSKISVGQKLKMK